MKILNVLATVVGYSLAGISFMTGLPLMGFLWLTCGVINHFISLSW